MLTIAPKTFQLVCYQTVDDIPAEAARALLMEHAHFMHDRMVEGGGPSFDIMPHVHAFWDNIEQYLPPNGRFYLAWNENGDLIGTAALHKISSTTGEMKHMHVRRQARRMGLGRALVQQRIEDAKQMGLTTLVAETFSANPEMPALYDQMGFERSEALDAASVAKISPELLSHTLSFRMELNGAG